MIGDNGRRGQLQNLPGGVAGTGQADDQFGGPAPDNNHLTGVILRLNPDGTTPTDNPFAGVTAQDVAQLEQAAGVVLTQAQIDEVVANIHKIFSYGRRNGFGLAFDPATGNLWESENGDDAFDELNRITPGSNGGWVQFMGPIDRLDEFKEIESTFTAIQGNLGYSAADTASFIPALQQLRWPPSLTADTPGEALSRLFALPGSQYRGPRIQLEVGRRPGGHRFRRQRTRAQVRRRPVRRRVADLPRRRLSVRLQVRRSRAIASPSATRSSPTTSTTTTTSSTRARAKAC